ncbi:ABC-type polysaccharide/polyol phosphate export permease [Paenibacillus sp. JGP012]|uniref:ABC transporter permease n=1 Tax=Paenibacillus sp. JGP012 TaxID=2735914 RepID=UPI001618CF53|nr:ABC transporter permease [Paenibacillus sp. JGP012]MBB6024665.1 ABC-type polysaccharide/polyol phosphate export permease [Paenibacillus sp. JGP012]
MNTRDIFLKMVNKDFFDKYTGSYLGILWSFIHPVITILVYWFIFQVGFRNVPVDNLPFIIWFLAGIIPWFYFSEAVNSATYSIVENSFLVKKVVFPVKILPLIKICSALYVHMFFVIIMILIFVLYGYDLHLFAFQIVYYSFSLIALITVITKVTSVLYVFLKDTTQIITMILQILFWLTPIFWNLSMIPSKYQFLFKLNPMFYIVGGYRDSLFYEVWFWQKPMLTFSFWLTVIFLYLVGKLMYAKLRPHFADVL